MLPLETYNILSDKVSTNLQLGIRKAIEENIDFRRDNNSIACIGLYDNCYSSDTE